MKFTPSPKVELVNSFARPYDNVVATARTCYSSRVVRPEDVSRDEKARSVRDRIYDSIYQAGHHTTLQHPTFQFVLERVSRHFLWSFLHSHPFYNSEQVSQRYVEVRPENFATPPMDDRARELYHGAIRRQMEAYHDLIALLRGPVEERYYEIFPARRRTPEKWEGAIEKRIFEVARYVLPVATHAHLYHTVSGITLHRYWRLCEQYDTPTETRIVVRKMVRAVEEVDPLFFRAAGDPMPLEQTPEFRLFETRREPGQSRRFVREFDDSLEGRRSRLVDWKVAAERTTADAVRAVLGAPADRMSDDDAIEALLHPGRNPVLGGTVRTATLSKLSRAMAHAHFTFRKKLSHTADSQDQRHRMVPGSRPILAGHLQPGEPDIVYPQVIEEHGPSRERFDAVMRATWEDIGRLREMGVPEEFANYLLPNAVAVRLVESGDLLNLHHKWTTRLCYLAQEEIWRCCQEEVGQIQERFPALGRHLLAPCGLRKEAGETPFCPEGARFCGVPVWEIPVAEYRRRF